LKSALAVAQLDQLAAGMAAETAKQVYQILKMNLKVAAVPLTSV
jgi:LytS/YehU family sensor histidine kinase